MTHTFAELRARRRFAAPLALGLALALAGCGGTPDNRLLDSIHQPVVDHASYTYDVPVAPEGISAPERDRLADWFTAMNLRYGDKVTLEDPLDNPATRAGVAAVTARYGLLLTPSAPPAQGYVNAGTVRITITRATATVPGCPDWSANSESNLKNGTSSNYGCAVNSNLAAMIANPDELLHGAGNADANTAHRSTKAINAYVYAAPTGAGGGAVKSTSSTSGN